MDDVSVATSIFYIQALVGLELFCQNSQISTRVVLNIRSRFASESAAVQKTTQNDPLEQEESNLVENAVDLLYRLSD